MRIFLTSIFLFIASLSFCQELSTVQKSAVPDSTAYFVNGKFTSGDQLKLISQDSIKSVNVIKRDTVVNNQKYDAQIFVILKSRKED